MSKESILLSPLAYFGKKIFKLIRKFTLELDKPFFELMKKSLDRKFMFFGYNESYLQLGCLCL